MVSRIKELAEETKISIRNIRRDANKAADQAEKDKAISEDERDSTKDEIQRIDQEVRVTHQRDGEKPRVGSDGGLNCSRNRVSQFVEKLRCASPHALQATVQKQAGRRPVGRRGRRPLSRIMKRPLEFGSNRVTPRSA